MTDLLLLTEDLTPSRLVADVFAEHWPTLLVLLAGIVGCALLVSMALRWSRLEAASRRQVELLGRIDSAMARLADSHGDLDLRRLEHVLIDIRDGQKRQEERLLALGDTFTQRREQEIAPERASAAPVEEGGVALRDRITSRLLALGFERIELLTSLEELHTLVGGDGDISVEARRMGAWHKGRVCIRSGSIADVKMRASFEAFP